MATNPAAEPQDGNAFSRLDVTDPRVKNLLIELLQKEKLKQEQEPQDDNAFSRLDVTDPRVENLLIELLQKEKLKQEQ